MSENPDTHASDIPADTVIPGTPGFPRCSAGGSTGDEESDFTSVPTATKTREFLAPVHPEHMSMSGRILANNMAFIASQNEEIIGMLHAFGKGPANRPRSRANDTTATDVGSEEEDAAASRTSSKELDILVAEHMPLLVSHLNKYEQDQIGKTLVTKTVNSEKHAKAFKEWLNKVLNAAIEDEEEAMAFEGDGKVEHPLLVRVNAMEQDEFERFFLKACAAKFGKNKDKGGSTSPTSAGTKRPAEPDLDLEEETEDVEGPLTVTRERRSKVVKT